MSSEDFEFFRTAIRERAGIMLSEAKRELLKSRLRSHILEMGLDGISQYRDHLKSLPTSHPEWQNFVNLMTTNKTDWFREPDHFDFLTGKFLPRWLAANHSGRPLRVWCAASSTGEEPYTLAMVLKQKLGDQTPFEVVASDIDTTVLEQAKNGVYLKDRVMAQVPPGFQHFAFAHGKREIADWVKVKKSVKDHVRFVQLNLLHFPYNFGNSFDVVFCRNVFIYFSQETIAKIIDAQFDVTRQGGLLIVGHSESLQAKGIRWSYIKPSVYVKGSLP